MPEMRPSANVPQPVGQELLLPDRFPTLPGNMRDRFGADAEDYDERLQSFWTRARRTLSDLHFDVARPVNEVKAKVEEEVTLLRRDILAGSAALGAFIEEISQVVTDVEGVIAAQWTLNVVAGNVVTGMKITSVGGSTTLSDITFLTDNLRVITSGTAVQLLNISAAGFVFGADLVSNNFDPGVAGWRLTRAGDLEANTGTFRGALAATSGTIGGFSINAGQLFAGGISLASAGEVRVGSPTGASIKLLDSDVILFNSSGVGVGRLHLDGSQNFGLFDLGFVALNGGTGVVKFGTHSPIGAETVTGFIMMNDRTGAPRKLAVLS